MTLFAPATCPRLIVKIGSALLIDQDGVRRAWLDGVADDLAALKQAGVQVCVVTSGAFGPTVGHPIAMGYVPARLAAPGTKIWGDVRGKRLPAEIVTLPFRPSTYKR